MSFTKKLLRGLCLTACALCMSVAMAMQLAPKGSSIKDIPGTLVRYRSQVSDPTTLKILDMLITEDQRIAIEAENAGKTTGRAAETIGEQSVKESDGDEGQVVAATGTVYDPRAVDTIRKMNVSDELKKEIWENYKRTGELPGISVDAPVKVAEKTTAPGNKESQVKRQ